MAGLTEHHGEIDHSFRWTVDATLCRKQAGSLSCGSELVECTGRAECKKARPGS